MSTKKILVAGRSGQVAQSLVEAAKGIDSLDLKALGRPDLDITDAGSIRRAVDDFEPDILINAAAYTAVDQAETDRDTAFLGNETGPRLLGDVTSSAGIPIIHLSTDYVFDGTAFEPYRESDPVSPLGVYGESKLAGETALASANAQHVILRTAWVYGAYGKNFLKTMLRVAADRDELRVVADQRGAPTSSHDIAAGIMEVADKVLGGSGASFGTYHMTAAGEAVWADFAAAIFDASDRLGGPTAKVTRITTEEYPTPAKRPSYSVLDSSRIETNFGVRLPDWQEPIAGIVARVLKESD